MGRISDRLIKTQTKTRFSASRIDTLFSRASHASQVLLLVLGGVGYFYTVLPLYQKALLDEDIAKKTLELNQKTQETALLSEQIKARTLELAARDKQLSELSSSVATANIQKLVAESKALKASAEANQNYVRIQREYLGGVFDRIHSCGKDRLFKVLREPPSNDPEVLTLSPVELQECVGKAVDDSREIMGTLRPGEFLRLKEATGKALLQLNPEYMEIMRASRTKLEPLLKELYPIIDTYAESLSLNRKSPEWLDANAAFFGNKGQNLREAIFAETSFVNEQVRNLLKRLTEMVWSDLQKPR